MNCRHDFGWCGLHVAVVNGHKDIIKLLVKSGADINVKDEFSTAQRIAARDRMNSIISELTYDFIK